MNSIVILVDDKIRDLAVSALIARRLEEHGVKCYLEPLESYQSCLAAYRPKMILFNLLTAGHLETYSRRLHEMGVVTGVLLNEGLCYNDERRSFNAGKFHNSAHIDYFFCWNQPMADALKEEGFEEGTEILVSGPPRFDFYFSPWRERAIAQKKAPGSKPSILVCSNLGLATLRDASEDHFDNWSRAWSARVPALGNYKEKVGAQIRAQAGLLDYIQILLDEGKYDVVLRLHPREKVDFYNQWYDGLSESRKKHLRIDKDSNISELILQCDLQIACENCTTTIESWLADKPTIALIFDKTDGLFFDFNTELNPCCESPSDIVALVDRELANPDQEQYSSLRQAHLSKWCASPAGKSTGMIADIIAKRVEAIGSPDWSKLNFTDYRRAAKLKFKHSLGLAYHLTPMLWWRTACSSKRNISLNLIDRKAVLPEDAKRAVKEISDAIEAGIPE